MQLIRIALVVIAFACAPRAAHAFVTGDQFDGDPLKSDAAGGIAFTGAPRWSGHTCAVCHTGAPGHISIRVEADLPQLFSAGWDPKQQYHLRVVLDNEIEGLAYAPSGNNCGGDPPNYKPCDSNGFALEMDDATGAPTGTLGTVSAGKCSPTPDLSEVYLLKDKSAVIHRGLDYAQTQWDFCWTAPPAGIGTVTAYVAVVDGNGGDGTANFRHDPTGDDVATGAIPLAERADTLGNGTDAGGCATSGPADGCAIVVVLGAIVLARRRRALVLAIAMLAGCVHVRPRQREVLARPNMKFAPDPGEDELDLHMQESREGSSGGYGSSGGGCGCN